MKLNNGGVSFEKSSNSFRGSVNIDGQRFKTRRFPTRLGARRALTKLINNMLVTIEV